MLLFDKTDLQRQRGGGLNCYAMALAPEAIFIRIYQMGGKNSGWDTKELIHRSLSHGGHPGQATAQATHRFLISEAVALGMISHTQTPVSVVLFPT